MYDWRRMSDEERRQALAGRQAKSHPWHTPPHRIGPGERAYMISTACFDHEPHIAYSAERLDAFVEELHGSCIPSVQKVYAWCVLPNHYHVVLQTDALEFLLTALGRLHGRTSYQWNDEEHSRGRKVWYNCFDREMRSYRHLMASINYVHHNPVKHRYVERWQDWPWSSAQRFLKEVGKERAVKMWKEYPLKDFGEGWDW